MIGKEQVVEVDLSSLVCVDEISIAAVDGVEGKSSHIHGYEVEVHAFDAG